MIIYNNNWNNNEDLSAIYVCINDEDYYHYNESKRSIGSV